jgi:hypothetical protein
MRVFFIVFSLEWLLLTGANAVVELLASGTAELASQGLFCAVTASAPAVVYIN